MNGQNLLWGLLGVTGLFSWHCDVCGKEMRCSAVSVNGEYVNIVCEAGHHQVAYGQMRRCGKCGKETIQVEILKWRIKPKPQFKIVGFVCTECDTRSRYDGLWQDS